MTSEPITGGCQCGAVRYRVAGHLEDPHICHCRMCQKAAGNYFMPLGRAARADFAVTRGEIAWFHSSDVVRRGFCKDCGTPLIFETIGGAGPNVTLGSLDNPAGIEPELACAPESALPWMKGLFAPDTGDDSQWYGVVARSNHQHPDHDTEQWPPENMP